MRKVFLVGTGHDYQMRTAFTEVSDHQFEEFIETLRGLIVQNGIRGIAEEMSIEILRNWRCTEPSIACQLAKELCIEHRYCDPDKATRQKLSIDDFEKRERHWLEQLTTFDRFPALFICAADHFASFKNLLNQSGFSVVEVAPDWMVDAPLSLEVLLVWHFTPSRIFLQEVLSSAGSGSPQHGLPDPRQGWTQSGTSQQRLWHWLRRQHIEILEASEIEARTFLQFR
jgi:hypothetical protein